MSGYYKVKFKKIALISSAGIKPKKTLFQKIKQKAYKILKKIGTILPYKKRKKYKDFLLKHFASNDFLALPQTLHKTFINIVNEDFANGNLSVYSKADGTFKISIHISQFFAIHRVRNGLQSRHCNVCFWSNYLIMIYISKLYF